MIISIKKTIKTILKIQLLWFGINLLILFFQREVPASNLGYIFEIYLISFKIVGRSIFISVILYLSTMIYNLDFRALGVTKYNLFKNLILGLKLSFSLLIGLIIINLISDNVTALFKIKDINSLSKSLTYFIITFFCYLIPAFSKELFFRGFINYQFSKLYPPWKTFIFTVLYYTISHLDLRISVLIINFLIALITTYLYYKTGSILASTIFQAAYKAAVAIYIFSPSSIIS